MEALYFAVCFAARCLLSGFSGTCIVINAFYDEPVCSVVLHTVTGPFVFVSSGTRNGISFWAFLYRYRSLRCTFYVVRFFLLFIELTHISQAFFGFRVCFDFLFCLVRSFAGRGVRDEFP